MSFRESQIAPWLVVVGLAGCAAAPTRPRVRPDAAVDAVAEEPDARADAIDLGPDTSPAEPAGPDAVLEEDATDPTITSNGCAAGACLNPTCQALGTPAAPGRFLELGFEPGAPYVPADVVIPTLDDAPDRTWTGPVLDWLESRDLHLDFFVDIAHCDAGADAACAGLLARILRTQNPGDHTAHHLHLGTDCRALEAGGPRACEDEITGVESLVQVISNGGIGHLSRLRAPFGEPFQKGGSALAELQGVVARFAVHVGWAIDAGDEDAAKPVDAAAAIANVTRALEQGARGIVRLPAAAPWSLGMLQALLDPKTGYAATHQLRIGTVEDAVCWKYGRHSWELVSQITGHRVGEN